MKKTSILICFVLLCSVFAGSPVVIGTYPQEKSTFYNVSNGLASADVADVAVTDNGLVYAATSAGLCVFDGRRWTSVSATTGKKTGPLAVDGNRLLAVVSEADAAAVKQHLYTIENDQIKSKQELDGGLITAMTFSAGVYLASQQQVMVLRPGRTLEKLAVTAGSVRGLAVGPQGELYAATSTALEQYDPAAKKWQPVYPRDGKLSWAPIDVRDVCFDRSGRLWFVCPAGAGCLAASGCTLYTGHDGLPYDDFTSVAAGEEKVVWFGTHLGAIRFDGHTWEYRQGKRWLPDDDVRALAVNAKGQAWFATSRGAGTIERVPMTLAQKAAWFEDEIDRYHRRTPYEYVLEVSLNKPGDKSEWRQHDSDNDGLWTSMYGAGECFAYAATKQPLARDRARKAFKALEFLGKVTQGGSHPAPPGFVARTILPTSGRDPNIGRVEEDVHKQKNEDTLWKVFDPRWPKSADGKWYWKTDTSSDELDGHYFFYGLYYDLVAESEEDKTAVRRHVAALTNHLIDHDFKLVDHDGTPTRWARYDPRELNFDARWFYERGLNSLSMLSYLLTTAHITGDARYRHIADTLITRHSYLQNMINMKTQRGMGSGNHSDDEMAFMCYYNLLKYETDPARRAKFGVSFFLSWRFEYPEMNPLFNFMYAAVCSGLTYTDQWGTHDLNPTGEWLEDAVDMLKRFPLDRVNWQHDNRHRTDLVRLSGFLANFDEDPESFKHQGYRTNGKVIPVDESFFNHWNRNPFELTTGGDGRGLADGAVFLLPYYMGLHHGFIKE